MDVATPGDIELGWAAWYTLAVIAAMTVALVRGVRAQLVLTGALALLLVAGVLTPAEAFSGFSNPAVVTIGLMFIVAAGVEQTAALGFLDGMLRPRSAQPGPAVARLMFPNAVLSAFTNNTPQVAMFIPRVQAWARESGIPASKLLIPLSTASIVGGWLALIGTSTNLVVDGYLHQAGHPGFSFFELAWVGVPASIVVTLYYALVGHRLLPTRDSAEPQRRAREYQFDVRVRANAPFVGRPIEAAGLRTLGDAYLVHLHRDGEVRAARPDATLLGGDILTFVGAPHAIDALLSRPGLERKVSPVDGAGPDLPLVEAVVASGSALIGQTLREVDFRAAYGGVVLAIQRQDEPIEGALGRVPLRAGDLLLIEGGADLADRLSAAHATDFALVTPLELARPVPGKAPIALGLLALVIVVAAAGWMPLETAALLAAIGVVVTGCLKGSALRQAVDFPVLVVVASALALGLAVEKTGLGAVAASGVLGLGAGAHLGPVAMIAVVYLCTNVLTELITHKAAAVLMLPVALAVAEQLGANPKAFAVAVCIGAAASFLTPIGYQTNLMVMGPGGYRYGDYVRSGLPVSLLVFAVTVAACTFVWL